MGKKFEEEKDPADLSEEEGCKCEIVCKCVRYHKYGEPYKTCTEKCDDLKKGIPTKCKSPKKCRKAYKKKLYEQCEQIKKGIKIDVEEECDCDENEKVRKANIKSREKEDKKEEKKWKKEEKKNKCCCKKLSLYEWDELDPKCAGRKVKKKKKKRTCLDEGETLVLLKCNCKKPLKAEREEEEGEIIEVYDRCKEKRDRSTRAKLKDICARCAHRDELENFEDKNDDLQSSSKGVCKTKREKILDQWVKKGKITEECKQEILTKDYENLKKEESIFWKCRKHADPCDPCLEYRLLQDKKGKKYDYKKRPKVAFKYNKCSRSCIKYKRAFIDINKDDKKDTQQIYKVQNKDKAYSTSESESEGSISVSKDDKTTKHKNKKQIESTSEGSIRPTKKAKKDKKAKEKTENIQGEELRYLLPKEYNELSVKEKCERENQVKEYLKQQPDPYRCVRACVDPKTAELKYHEYICYPPPICPTPICQHPAVSFPKDCKCIMCTEKSCDSQVCKSIRRVRKKINYVEPEKCEPITICVPVTDPKPPMVCADCPLEIRLKESDFHIVDAKNVKNHIKMMNEKLKKVVEETEKRNLERKLNIKRFC